MKSRSRYLLLLILLSFSVCLMPISAQDSGDSGESPAETGLHVNTDSGLRFGHLTARQTAASLPPLSLDANTTASPAADSDLPTRDGQSQASSGPTTVLIVLDSPAALESVPSSTNGLTPSAEATVQAASVQASSRQTQLISRLRGFRGVQVLGRTRLTINAVAAVVDASQIDAIAALPGVQAVIPDQYGTLDNANSVPFINTIQAWEAAGGYTGSGIRVGIIDSGIDYTHANFGGSGNLSHFTGNDRTNIADFGFDGSKVVGGYDFVGEGWTSGQPLHGAGGSPLGSAWVFAAGDNDPLDCAANGHGSHVAGTVAGFGVDGGGATFTGPWDSTVPFGTMTIGPGVAPEASLYALKIGDCTTSVSFVAAVLAFDFAVDPNGDGNPSDHLDVVNNSYGGAYGSALEVLDTQVNLASQAGVIVVMSAGNEGDTYYINGDPSVSPWGISVAASAADTSYSGLELTTGDGSYPSYPTNIAANPSTGGATGSHGPYSLRLVGGTGNSQGCNAANYSGFAGEVGLIIWSATASGCGSGTRMTNAVNNGNVAGLVVVSANPADFPFINLACTYLGGPSPIPCVSITNADGQNLAANIGAFTVRFDSSIRVVGLGASTSIADTLAGFSSRGPSIIDQTTGETILKPDITAPGMAIVSTDVGTGNEAISESGTSMASPHVTGVAALMRQVHPTWSVSEIKALMMNTANHDLWTDINQTGDNYGVSRIGAGRVDVGLALGSEVIAYASAHPERVSVSFSLVEVIDSVTVSQSITIENRGSSSQTYNLSFQNLNNTPGVTFGVSPSQVTVGAGASQTVQVTLTANEASMANVNTPDPTTPVTQSGAFGNLPRERIMEAGGYVVFTPTTTTSTLRVPVHALARPASDMAAAGPLQIGQADVGIAALQLAGNDIFTGLNTPLDIISQVSAFEVVGEDPQTLDPSIANADIQYVGVTSDYASVLELCSGDPACAIANTTVYIGVVTYGDWSTMSCFDACFDIGFDSDENNGYDTHAFNFETGYLINADFTDTILSWYTDGASWVWGSGNVVSATDFLNGYDPSTLETYVYNNNVIVYPVAADAIGLTTGNTDFQFDVLASSAFITGDWLPIDPPYWYSYDVANPTYEFNDSYGIAGGPFPGVSMWFDLDGNSIPVGYDVTGLTDPLPPILLLHHHNSADATVGRAELVQVERTTNMDGMMTKTVNNDAPTEAQTVTFTLTVSNNGPGVVEEPIIVDTLPTGLTYVSDTCPVGTTQVAVANGVQITCDLTATGTIIPAGFSLTITIDATVNAGTTGSSLTNEAELTGWNPNSTDTDPSNNISYVSVCVGGTPGNCNPPPRVSDVQENTGISLISYPTVGTNVSQLRVMFNMPVRGGTTTDGASNAANYRLLAEGSSAGFQTSVCNAPIDAGDAALGLGASYNAGTNSTSLTITSAPLAAGNYRLIVCGSTSILNTQGVALDGNNDGGAGDDAVINFTVNFSGSGVVSPDGTVGSSSLTSQQLDAMSLPATGEVPWYMPTPAAIALVVMGAVVVGIVVIRRR
ncbi:MAG: S8 family serine peptidase [Anaerolineae bacterium]